MYLFFRYRIEEDGSLIIKKIKMEDTGMLQCVATNEAGSESVATWLKVKSKYICIFNNYF